MTDSIMWKKVKERFFSMTKKNEEGEIIDFPYFIKDGDEITNVIEPNTAKERPTDELWFEIFPLHSQPHQQELGKSGRNRWNLGLQININTPKNSSVYYGTDAVDDAYDFIAENFKRGDIFDGIRVTQTAYRSSARLLDDYYSEPVTVMLQADLEN